MHKSPADIIKTTERKHKLLILLLLLITGSLAYFWIMKPHIIELCAMRGDLKAYRKLRELGFEMAVVQKEHQQKLNALRVQLAESDGQFFPSVAQCHLFFESLENIAIASECQITSISFVEAQKAAGADKTAKPAEATNVKQDESADAKLPEKRPVNKKPSRMTVLSAKISLMGTYPDIIAFTEILKDSQYNARIGELNLALINSDNPTLRANFILTAYALEAQEGENK